MERGLASRCQPAREVPFQPKPLTFGHESECFPACHPQNGFCEDDNVSCPLLLLPGGGGGSQSPLFSPRPPDVRACASTPCANNGTCVNLESGHYECSCAPGFSGKDCQEKDGPCVINGADRLRSRRGGLWPAGWVTRLPGGHGLTYRLTPGVHELPVPQPEHRILKVSMKELNKSAPLLSEGQAICFTVLGVLTSLVVLGTVGIVFLNKCEAWVSNLRYNRVLRKKRNVLLQYNSGEDLAVNIIFPEKIDMTTFSKEAGEDDI
uniref:EGF-like domain-containing protein n=1 Tax=Panthera tigris altaica TaxID=74533 RepID=A0A8C9KDE6_PANTA